MTSAEPGRRSPMRYPVFRRFVFARSLSQAGGWMQVVAAGFLVYDLTGDAAAVGVLAVLSKLPTLVGTPLGGTLADRYDHRRLAMFTLALQAIPPAVMALLALDHSLTTAEIYVLVFAGAIPSAITSPVLQEILPHLVPEDVQRQAMADSAVAFNVARTAGPAIGGGLVAAVGVPLAFAINSLSFVGVLAMLRSLPPDSEAEMKGRLGKRRQRSFREGLKAVWELPLMRTLLIAATVFFVYVGPIEQVMPAIAAEHGEGAAYIGILLSAIALGGIAANPLVRRLNDREAPALIMMGIAIAISGLLLVLLGLSSALATDLAILLALGAAWEVVWVTSWTTTHFRSPEGVSGEAMGLLLMTYSLGVAGGALLAGWLFDRFGVADSLVGTGIVLMALAVVPTFLGRRIRDAA